MRFKILIGLERSRCVQCEKKCNFHPLKPIIKADQHHLSSLSAAPPIDDFSSSVQQLRRIQTRGAVKIRATVQTIKIIHCKFTAWNLLSLQKKPELDLFSLSRSLPQRIPLKYTYRRSRSYTDKNAKIIIMIDIYFFNNFDRQSLFHAMDTRQHMLECTQPECSL